MKKTLNLILLFVLMPALIFAVSDSGITQEVFSIFLSAILIIVVVFILVFLHWIWMFIDCIKRDFKGKLFWLVLVVVVPFAQFFYHLIVKLPNRRIKLKNKLPTDAVAIVAFVLAFLSFVLFPYMGVVLGIVAIITSYIAKSRIKNGTVTGGLIYAKAAIIISIISIITQILLIVVYFGVVLAFVANFSVAATQQNEGGIITEYNTNLIQFQIETERMALSIEEIKTNPLNSPQSVNEAKTELEGLLTSITEAQTILTRNQVLLFKIDQIQPFVTSSLNQRQVRLLELADPVIYTKGGLKGASEVLQFQLPFTIDARDLTLKLENAGKLISQSYLSDANKELAEAKVLHNALQSDLGISLNSCNSCSQENNDFNAHIYESLGDYMSDLESQLKKRQAKKIDDFQNDYGDPIDKYLKERNMTREEWDKEMDKRIMGITDSFPDLSSLKYVSTDQIINHKL